MTTFTPDENAPLLIEITPAPGVQELAFSSEELAAKDDEVMQKVMDAIHNVPMIGTPTYCISSHRWS